jgi:hypothetical protein
MSAIGSARPISKQQEKTPEAQGRSENLQELLRALGEFASITEFLEHVGLVTDTTEAAQEAMVSIMTLHAAKGLEFPVVFLPGWEDGLFPSQRSMDESGKKGLEEERRSAYVGLTRAEELATISFAANRRVYGQWQNALPSRFIDELPEAHVEVLTPPGLYGGGYGAAGMASSIETKAMNADVYNSPGWRRMQDRADMADHALEIAVVEQVGQPEEDSDHLLSFGDAERGRRDPPLAAVAGIADEAEVAFRLRRRDDAAHRRRTAGALGRERAHRRRSARHLRHVALGDRQQTLRRAARARRVRAA